MDKKEDLLKLLGFSEELIEKINDDTFEDAEFTSIPESTSVVEPSEIIPTDLKDVIIDKTQKPQSLVYNSTAE